MKTMEQRKHKAFLAIICLARALFLFLGYYPHKTHDPNPTQILAVKLAGARNIELNNPQEILSDFGMKKLALEKAPAG